MSSQITKQLQEPPSAKVAQSSALDTLNKSFVDSAHLDDLQAILDDACNTQVRLKQHLIESEKETDALTTNTRIEAMIQLDKAKELASLRDSLEDDLAYLSHDLVSALSPTGDDNAPTLLEDIETMHRALKELESVRSYVVVVERSLKLSEDAVSQMRRSSSPITTEATSKYQALLAFVNEVRHSCGLLEDIGNSHGSLNLISFLERICEKTWADMKATLFSTLISASETLNWPTAVDYVAANKKDRAAFESAVLDLLRLQEIGESLRSPRENEGLYPLQALVHPVALRFKYHFDSERETSRLDKPEWYFTHIANVAHDHRPFMEGVMQRLISGSKFQDVNAWHNYTTLLLPILERKLKRSVPLLLTRPALLAHTVYQSLIFDSSLRDMGYEFSQENRDANGDERTEAERGGISKVILDQKDWFNAWLEGEKKFADDQYHEIISAADAWVIADDDRHEYAQNHVSQDTALKATTSARRIKALVEQVTDRYSPLPSFRQRTQFLIHVQLPILELYHSRISSSLDAFETLSSALVRAVPGALGVDGPKTDTRKLTGGVEGSQRLCKALLSAKYIENAMRIWGEEVFFLELLVEINHRASLRMTAGSYSSLPEYNARPGHGTTTSEGTIFEELVTQFAKLSSRAEDMLVQQICGECEGALKSHFAALAAQMQDMDDNTVDVAVSSTLLPAVALLSSHLAFLRNTLPASVVTRLYRRTASRISEHVLQRQVLFRPGLTRGAARNGLTRTQARVVQAECELWAETSQVAMNTSRARIEKPWSRLLAAGRLLGADLQQHEKLLDAIFGGKSDGWEELLDNVTALGSGGLGMDEVKTVLRLRDDCRR
ncbi:TIP-1 family-domain-containing protein [Boletus edulis BED1]|uniref:TIP-1 family-domain-containing protein n=1 Tax=Boletus edulis BED1 TaxID=1328754 RepID=A0AAD4C1T1_BOLED|nr:TIP-1 family-domain-containing protein [Boletus edulis BED1]